MLFKGAGIRLAYVVDGEDGAGADERVGEDATAGTCIGSGGGRLLLELDEAVVETSAGLDKLLDTFLDCVAGLIFFSLVYDGPALKPELAGTLLLALLSLLRPFKRLGRRAIMPIPVDPFPLTDSESTLLPYELILPSLLSEFELEAADELGAGR